MTDAFYVAFRIPNLFARVWRRAPQPGLRRCWPPPDQDGDAGAKALVDHVATLT
jgi:putative peptidoglycan lipid II flippase